MKLTLFSNFLNHHQKPFCDAMVKIIGDQFRFVSTTNTPEQFLNGGYLDYENEIYNVCTHHGKIEEQIALELARTSDIVIFGSSQRKYLKERLKTKKLTYIYSERLLKKSKWMRYNPRVIRFMLRFHTIYRNKNVHLLCASAFVANEMKWFFAYPNKMYKWGYFTKFQEFSIQKSLEDKNNQRKIKISWVSRFIKLKNPMLVVKLASYLKQKGYLFELSMIGDGKLYGLIKDSVIKYDLEDCVILTGNQPNSKVLNFLRKSHIFLMTSNRKEGWGAVMNEALSNGCAVVASNEIGSAPYLVRPNQNGLIFKSEDLNSLTRQVEVLINDSNKRSKLAFQAYEDMKNIWSPQNAAQNLITLSKAILNKENNSILKGPCSRAERTKSTWYLD